jgi:hypothetical protein
VVISVPLGVHPGHRPGHIGHETATTFDDDDQPRNCLITSVYCQLCFERIVIDFQVTERGAQPCAQQTLLD